VPLLLSTNGGADWTHSGVVVTYGAAPAPLVLSPTVGPASGPWTLLVFGAGFAEAAPGALLCRLTPAALPPSPAASFTFAATYLSPSRLSVAIGSGGLAQAQAQALGMPPGAYAVALSANGGGAWSDVSPTLTLATPPTLTAAAPDTVHDTGGALVQVSGKGFLPAASLTCVWQLALPEGAGAGASAARSLSSPARYLSPHAAQCQAPPLSALLSPPAAALWQAAASSSETTVLNPRARQTSRQPNGARLENPDHVGGVGGEDS
jgi:hypothetical protein